MNKQGKMGKGMKITSGIVIGLLVILLLVYFFIFSSSTVSAQLHIESGQVFVNNQLVQENMKLSEGDTIKTGPGGLVTVILYESIVVNLEENTEISIDELVKKHPKISQNSGETWNTFTKLSGVEEYSAEVGNSVASVRATSFGLRDDYILGGEGTVDYNVAGRPFMVSGKKVVENPGTGFIERDANPGEIQKINQNILRAIEELRYIRGLEIKKKPIVYNLIKKQTGYTDEELKQYLEDIDNGLINLDELINQAPIKTKTINNAIAITRKIQELKTKL